MHGFTEVDRIQRLDDITVFLKHLSAFDQYCTLRVLSIRNKKKSILLLSGFIAAVVLDKAHNLVRKGFPAGFAEMDMNVKGRAADVLHKVGFGGQRGSGCGGAGLAGFIVHRLLLSMRKAPCGSTWGGG